MTMRAVWLIAVGAWSAGLPLGCASGGVGDPCVPEEEYEASFSGFSTEEVNTESRSFSCQTRLCLVNHFQGRVSCPYGQVKGAAAGQSSECFVPDTDVPVRAAVAPQLLARRADDAVYCSCRCDGPDPSARYCECPSGFECKELVPRFSTSVELAGSYCVREGTAFDEVQHGSSGTCDRALANCD